METLDRPNRSATAPVHSSTNLEPLGTSLVQPIPPIVPTLERPLPPEVEAMRFWKPIWPKAMARLKETEEAPGRQDRGFSIRKAEAWNDVEEAFIRAREAYEFSWPKGSWLRKFFGRIKKHGRDLGDTVAGPIKQIIKVVPSNDIASPILGAVNLLMNAWQESIKAGKEVAESFDDRALASLFTDMDFHLDMFRDDQNVFNASVNLLVTVFKGVEGAIGFYTSWQISRFGKAIFQGETYLHSLRDSLKQIKADEVKLTKVADMSYKWRMNEHSKRMDERSKRILSEAAKRSIFVVLDARVTGMDIRTVLRETKLHGPQGVSVTPRDFMSSAPEANAVCTIESLLEALGSTNVDEDDMTAVFSRAGAFPEKHRARAEQVVGSLAFRKWVATPGASKLLVHGEYDQDEYSAVSPLSALCAALVQAVRTRHEFVTLVFFCGRHINPRRDDHAGASGLMRSLITQLLQQCPSACPDAMGSDMSLSKIEDGELEVLIRLFIVVACRLPASKTLAIFIDGVQLYERLQFREGLHEVVDKLLELADDEGPMHSTLKVLLSSPWQTRTKELYRAFSGNQAILSMESLQDTGQSSSRSGVANAIGRELDHFPEEDQEA